MIWIMYRKTKLILRYLYFLMLVISTNDGENSLPIINIGRLNSFSAPLQ